ncbi:MAG: DUF1266 domain-containing protein [Pseudomonadales bacterium]
MSYQQAAHHADYHTWWLCIASPQISFQKKVRSYLLRHSVISPDSAEYSRDMLRNDWGIEDRSALQQMIVQLANCEHHGTLYLEEYRRASLLTARDWREYCDGQDSSPLRHAQLALVEATALDIGSAGIQAWDWCRAAYITRDGFNAGWVSEEEWDFIHAYLSGQIRANYKSWQQYTKAFFLGRYFWWSFNEESEQSEAQRADALLQGSLYNHYHNSCRAALRDTDNPAWRLPWQGIELPTLEAPQSLLDTLNGVEA